MLNKLRSLFKAHQAQRYTSISPRVLVVGIPFLVTAFLFLLNQGINFQILEWVVYDQYFRLRPGEKIDSRLLIITVDEPDLSRLQQWPLSDASLLHVLQQINQHDPRVIALDIYRDFPVPPGGSELESFFRTTPHLIGVEKIGGTPVPPPPVLAEQNQVGVADILMDEDGTVRRALLSVKHEGKERWTLGAGAAILYLEKDGIFIDSNIPDELTLSTGTSFPRLQPNMGGYTRADNRGYQILLNFRGPDNNFETISIYDVMTGQISEELVQERIVLIGSIAPSLNDFTYTPYNASTLTDNLQSPGVAIHAHIASQLINAALEQRQQINALPSSAEWTWAYLWCLLGSSVILLPQWQAHSKTQTFIIIIISIFGLSVGLLISNGILFMFNFWVPSIPSLLGIIISATVCLTCNNLKFIQDAYIDGLTEVLNRRAFNQQLLISQKQSQAVSIILCDIDYFKGYNDLYGHPQGDICLRQVAQAIRQSIRSQDTVARYGGEEFVVILHGASVQKACEIAERMRQRIQDCQLPHEASQVSSYVSISCGVAVRNSDNFTPLSDILVKADTALYKAKEQGRNQIVLFNKISIVEI